MESGILGMGSIAGVLEGKHYNWAVCMHKVRFVNYSDCVIDLLQLEGSHIHGNSDPIFHFILIIFQKCLNTNLNLHVNIYTDYKNFHENRIMTLGFLNLKFLVVFYQGKQY